MGNKGRESRDCPRLLYRKICSLLLQGGGTQAESSGLERIQNCKAGEAMVARFHKAEHLRGERDIYRGTS